ncbi:zinc-dependent metalloprotease [Pantanalinema rosaneae CENA516]|uniref:zinc-dependent metalloprotease n=1 Tax=Pantanalinema rosaneae TaxID=1620701 RepID=UPI003D6F5DEA
MKKIAIVLAFWFSLLLVLGTASWHPAFPELGQRSELQAIAKQLNSPQPPSPTSRAKAIGTKPASQQPITPLDPFASVIGNAQRLAGLFTLYFDPEAGKLFAEIAPDQLNVQYLWSMTRESGIGDRSLVSGQSLPSFVFMIRQVKHTLQLVVPNLYFRARSGDPIERSVRRSFSESILATLPIQQIHPQRHTFLVDLEPLLLSDLPGFTADLSAALDAQYSLDSEKSTLGNVQVFPKNVELETIYSFSLHPAEQSRPQIPSLPDNRNLVLRAHYSWSRLPDHHGYRPRFADDRVGYFITAYQDLSQQSHKSPFVRYINRWHLEKQNPTAPLSPPKQPIVFWLENSIPPEYRDTVKAGVLLWNKAFEQAGFVDVIEVRQMPDDATWSPADARYNTIRWLTAYYSGFDGLAPIRVNPLTGEILDADILIDASFARGAKQRYLALEQERQASERSSPFPCPSSSSGSKPRSSQAQIQADDRCYRQGASRQFALGAMALSMLHHAAPASDRMQEYVRQYLQELIAHEVGHTLGLRHNFRASAMLSPTELNNTELTHTRGLTASVMDYTAVNLAPPTFPQGDYFTTVVGPYDEWAIAYGYTPFNARTPQAEQRFLEAIVRRSPEPALAYGTDEDAAAELDPQIQVFDLSSDLLTYAPWQFENAQRLWQALNQHAPRGDEGLSEVRDRFETIFHYYASYGFLLTNYIGGQSFNRYRSGSVVGRLPLEPISAEQQRQALDLLDTYIFAANAFRFSPELLNKLTPARWEHWGEVASIQLDYPIHDRILWLQTSVLQQLFSRDRLVRLQDAELKAKPGQSFTLANLFETLQTIVWQEVLPNPTGNSLPLATTSLRRGLQQAYLHQMIQMALRKANVPREATTLARYHLKQLRDQLSNTLDRSPSDRDTATQAHWEEVHDRILKALDAQLQTQ